MSHAIVNAARAWIGTPYLHQASLQGAGTDCLGLLRGIWRDCLGAEPVAVPAYTADWSKAASAADSKIVAIFQILSGKQNRAAILRRQGAVRAVSTTPCPV